MQAIAVVRKLNTGDKVLVDNEYGNFRDSSSELFTQFIGMLIDNSGPIFNAYRETNFAGAGNITYSGSHANVGNGMTEKDGLFIAPVSGTYYLHFQGVSDHKSSRSIFTNIKLNGKTISSAYKHAVR